MLAIFFLLSPLALALALDTPFPTATPTPATPGHTVSDAVARPTLAPRCGDGDCTFGGSETTLQASVVTSTILSVTSVPCYITTYITDSTTVVSTVYSTETITSTVTSDGTVFVIKYSPTPVLMSSVYESIIELTETLVSYWTTTTGTAYETTYTESGAVESAGGGWGESASMGEWTAAGDGGGADAWTHVGAATAAADNAAVMTLTAGKAASTSKAAATGWSSSTASGQLVQWSAATPTTRYDATMLVCATALAIVLYEASRVAW